MIANDYRRYFLEELAKWPLFIPAHEVTVHVTEPGRPRVAFGYLSDLAARIYSDEGLVLLDLELDRDTLYGLSVWLKPQHRGQGLGQQLYEVWERLGRRLGCRRIVGYPSGWTSTGETRADYMLRHGFTLMATGEVEKVL